MEPNENQLMELLLWKSVASIYLSPSHDFMHVDLVLKFAKQLQAIYGGDPDVLTAAVVLHDLGRTNPNLHGNESIESSIIQARNVLKRIKFPVEKVERVVSAIREHDNPKIKPSTIEGRILKDSDFLAGFGPYGLLRIAQWAGETREGLSHVLDRLENRLPERLHSLEFPESVKWALSSSSLTNLVLSIMKDPNYANLPFYKGKYIVLEGISGSGKDTQVDILRKKLSHKKIAFVNEPSETYAHLRTLWEADNKELLNDSVIRQSLLIADRSKLIEETVKPALENGDIVISNRSFLSFLVYQCDEEGMNDPDLFEMAFLHRFVPIPDLIIVYDLDPEIAMERITERKKERSRYEKLDLLTKHRNKYLSLIKSGFYGAKTHIIDAASPVEKIAEETLQLILEVIDVE